MYRPESTGGAKRGRLWRGPTVVRWKKTQVKVPYPVVTVSCVRIGPSSSQPPFQSKAKCEVFVMKISFHSY